MVNIKSLRDLYLEHWHRINNDVPGKDFKKWVRLEDPNENYKDSVKK